MCQFPALRLESSRFLLNRSQLKHQQTSAQKKKKILTSSVVESSKCNANAQVSESACFGISTYKSKLSYESDLFGSPAFQMAFFPHAPDMH